MGHARRRGIHQLSSALLSQRRDNRLSVAFIPQWTDWSLPVVELPKSPERSHLYGSLWPPPLWATALAPEREANKERHWHAGKPCGLWQRLCGWCSATRSGDDSIAPCAAGATQHAGSCARAHKGPAALAALPLQRHQQPWALKQLQRHRRSPVSSR